MSTIRKGTAAFKIKATTMVLKQLKQGLSIDSKSLLAQLEQNHHHVSLRTCQRMLNEMMDAGVIRPLQWGVQCESVVFCATVDTKKLLGIEVQS